MGKGGCGRSASNLSAGQTMRAATTSLRGGGLVASRGGLGGAAPSSSSTASSGAAGGTTGHASAASESSAAAQPSDNGDWLDWIDQDKYEPRPNAQPGAWLPVMRLRGSSDARDSEQQQVVLQTMKWGLYPHYKKEPPGSGAHFQMFNARSEDGVKSQKRLVGRKQCVIISAGFYEFKEVAGRAPGVFTGPKTHKQGYYVHFKGSAPMYFAGLYDTWRQQDDPEAMPLYTCTILTTEPSEKLRWLHNRMPVILDTNQKVQQWLSATADDDASIAALSNLYVGCDSPALAWYPVTRELNSARYQGLDCTAELSLGPKNAMQNFFKPVRPRKGAQEQVGKVATVPQQETVAKKPQSAAAAAAKESDLTASTQSPHSASPAFGGSNVGSSPNRLMLRPCGQPFCSSDSPVSIAIPTQRLSAPDDDVTASKNCNCPSNCSRQTIYPGEMLIDMIWTPLDLRADQVSLCWVEVAATASAIGMSIRF